MTNAHSGLLLDTNVVIWLLTNSYDAVPANVVELLEDENQPVHVSAVNYWEIAIKRSLKKVTLPDGWATALTRLAFTPLAISAHHATAVATLPWHHRDPFDRLLVAQAKAEGLALVTADRHLDDYPVHTVW